jgi:hypothetical protein
LMAVVESGTVRDSPFLVSGSGAMRRATAP